MARREYPEAPVVGVGAVVIHRDQVLLVKRGQEPLKGEWSLPGGVLELGETLESGVRREVAEETGLVVKPVRIIETLDRIVKDRDDRVQYHYVLIDFLCEWIEGKAACASDASDLRWVTHEQLNSHSVYKIAPYTAAVIEKGFRLASQGDA